MDTQTQITGVMVNYYFICRRELWLFAHQIQMEQTSDIVYMGKLIGEESYNRFKKEVMIDNTISVDFIGRDGVIHETKKSDKAEKAHEFQLLYYLYYLKQKGISNIRGELNYPKLKLRKAVELTPELEKELESVLNSIRQIVKQPDVPPPKKLPYCRTCSYFEYCWID